MTVAPAAGVDGVRRNRRALPGAPFSSGGATGCDRPRGRKSESRSTPMDRDSGLRALDFVVLPNLSTELAREPSLGDDRPAKKSKGLSTGGGLVVPEGRGPSLFCCGWPGCRFAGATFPHPTMKLLLKILGGLAAAIVALLLAAFFFPREYRIERTITINAKPETVFALCGDLGRWKDWGAWQERDPGMKITQSEKTTGVGAWNAWISKSEGNGKMTITAYEPLKRVVYNLEFPDMGMGSIGSVTLESAGAGVKVIWVDAGDLGMNPMSRWFGLFLDRIIGPDFERGLVNLKRLAETGK
jgi:hypothetical protein